MVGDFVICSGPSMMPTLKTDQILFTERITARMNRIERGDIIIAKCPVNPTQNICKRVVGLPGDRIILAPALHLNPLNNSTASNVDSIDEKEQDVMNDGTFQGSGQQNWLTKREIIVPRGFCWLEGDNAGNSSDSRYYGCVPLGLIRSRAILRVYPLNELKVLV
jgi:mitochondrial inner membrane protease subunit 1